MAGQATRRSIFSFRPALCYSSSTCFRRSPTLIQGAFHRQTRSFYRTASHRSESRNNAPFQHLYQPIENVETIESYLPGGYHPVRIGDVFNARYRVVHKLGHGTFSTIWLAQDQKSNHYVAIKVCTADSNPREISVLEELSHSKAPGADTVKPMIPLVLDKFYTEGPNGAHACFVTRPARMSLADAKHASKCHLFQLDVARALAAQLVIAIDFVHSHGFVHGDIHLGNVLLQVPTDFSKRSSEKEPSLQTLYKRYGEPQRQPVKRLDKKPPPPGVPSHVVLPIPLGKASEEVTLSEANIILSDFGEAFAPAKKQIFESHTPFVSRAPEIRFEPHKPISYPSDIWSLGCTIWNLVARCPLFDNILATEDDIVCEQVEALGLLPEPWWSEWEGRHSRFTEEGESNTGRAYRSWNDRFEGCIQEPRLAAGMPPIDPAEREALCSLLRETLSFRPGRRPTTKEILESRWMVKWALPSRERP